MKDDIIDCLILNQSYIKHQLQDLKASKELLLETMLPIFREDLKEQYDARIKQWISFYVADRLAIPAMFVIIELERIEIDEYLAV
jgi:hypothetical protein